MKKYIILTLLLFTLFSCSSEGKFNISPEINKNIESEKKVDFNSQVEGETTTELNITSQEEEDNYISSDNKTETFNSADLRVDDEIKSESLDSEEDKKIVKSESEEPYVPANNLTLAYNKTIDEKHGRLILDYFNYLGLNEFEKAYNLLETDLTLPEFKEKYYLYCSKPTFGIYNMRNINNNFYSFNLTFYNQAKYGGYGENQECNGEDGKSIAKDSDVLLFKIKLQVINGKKIKIIHSQSIEYPNSIILDKRERSNFFLTNEIDEKSMKIFLNKEGSKELIIQNENYWNKEGSTLTIDDITDNRLLLLYESSYVDDRHLIYDLKNNKKIYSGHLLLLKLFFSDDKKELYQCGSVGENFEITNYVYSYPGLKIIDKDISKICSNKYSQIR